MESVEIFFRSAPRVVFEGGDRIGLESRSDSPSVVTKAISAVGMELGTTMGIKLRIELNASLGSLLSISVTLPEGESVGNADGLSNRTLLDGNVEDDEVTLEFVEGTLDGNMVDEGTGLTLSEFFRFSLSRLVVGLFI